MRPIKPGRYTGKNKPAHIEMKNTDIAVPLEPKTQLDNRPNEKNVTNDSQAVDPTELAIQQIIQGTSKTESAYLKKTLREKATVQFNQTLPDNLAKSVRNLVSVIQIAYKVEITKSSLLTLAIATIVWDFVENQKESKLFELLVKPQK